MPARIPVAGFLARTIDPLALLRPLQPELTRRGEAAPPFAEGALRLQTDIGSALLTLRGDGRVLVDSGDTAADAATIDLPQTELMRLALGAFPPADVLDRLPTPPSRLARRLVEALFPQRRPYLHLPDRI